MYIILKLLPCFASAGAYPRPKTSPITKRKKVSHARKGNSIGRMEELRKKGIKSLYVAYGGGIKGYADDNFKLWQKLGVVMTIILVPHKLVMNAVKEL